MAVRMFTHLYDNYDEALHTVQALEAAGVPHTDISIVGNNADSAHSTTGTTTDATLDATKSGAGATTGTVLGGGLGLLTGIGLLAIPGVGPVVAAGWLIATVTGAGLGAAGGGVLGSLIHAGVPEDHAHAYTEGVRRGGTLVSVRGDDTQAATIEGVLEGRTAAAVDMTARRAAYTSTGWEKFEDTAPHYTPDQVAAERTRYSRVS